jgi:hypothetical protein
LGKAGVMTGWAVADGKLIPKQVIATEQLDMFRINFADFFVTMRALLVGLGTRAA